MSTVWFCGSGGVLLSVINVCRPVSVVGYYIFRKSNSEKNRFRRDPTDPQLAREFYWSKPSLQVQPGPSALTMLL